MTVRKHLFGAVGRDACSILFVLTLVAPCSCAQTVSSDNDAADSGMRVLAQAINSRFTPAFLAPSSLDDAQDHSFASRFGDVLVAQANPKPQTEGTNPPQPQLGDLGFPGEQTQGNAQQQARLDKRSHMLKIHQRLGLITTIPLAGTLLTGGLAGGHSTSSTGRDLHATLGGITAGMYFTTAYYSIFAPRVPGTPTRGPIKLHKILAFIHGPGMVLTPILGAMAFDQKSKGERVHGIASAHSAVAGITAIAYGAAILSVSVRF